MPQAPQQLLFLPGASGNRQFWQPLAAQLRHPARQVHLGWPGFGDTPAQPDVQGMDDLVDLVLQRVDRPTALVAQSMGGIIAVRAALQRPELITHLVLSVTSGGVDMRDLGATDWRGDYAAAYPRLPRWFIDDHSDLGPRLGELRMPTLLLWGDCDPISPVAVGQRLARLLPRARLRIVPGADHDLGLTHANLAAHWLEEHLQRPGPG
ncbi:alpha/beta fold hydrolase [Pseudomonas sp. Fl5BN2]|uniref:alpha/beta fold hydrolase n=1 Tax=Pseudomonas sp. Fl5BN2 TaxID=2697652 RepID=UPI001377E3C1|nr:alpha/beta fold hydrolase [Pseudomonas sp. Fl5BN2]NBF06500.1 alpha/beta fold hydrolase [Pseudomonas sp. Fl5BN2]